MRISNNFDIRVGVGAQTVMMRMQRKMPAAVTKTPPEKRRMTPAFLRGFSDEAQSMGIGMLIR